MPGTNSQNTCSDAFIVMSAPTGARRDKSQHPMLPVTPDEIADCAAAVLREGASIIHLHVRDGSLGHSLEPSRYRDAMRAIRERVASEIVVQITTESCEIYSPQRQMEVVRELRPEAVSIALRDLYPDPTMENVVRDFSAWLRDFGVMAQHILYTPADVSRFCELRERQVLGNESSFVLFVLGSYTKGIDGQPRDIDRFRCNLSDDSVAWAICCFGGKENEAARIAAELGGHARVGMENNLLMPDGSVASDNAALVRLAVENGLRAGRSIADAGQVRAMFAP